MQYFPNNFTFIEIREQLVRKKGNWLQCRAIYVGILSH